jgi:hypothetical protein
MLRKKTLGYGLRMAEMAEVPAPLPARGPSSAPPSGIRLARPASGVPRPAGKSSAPPPPPVRPLAAAPKPRSSAPPPPRPAKAANDVLLLSDDDVTFVEDTEKAAPPPRKSAVPVAVASLRATGHDWPLVAQLTVAPAPAVPRFDPELTPPPSEPTSAIQPLSSIAPTAEVALAAEVAPSEPPLQPTPPVPWVALAPAAIPSIPPAIPGIEDASPHVEIDRPVVSASMPPSAPAADGWAVPPAAALADDDDSIVLPLSPLATLRHRAIESWSAAPASTRSMLTFAAGMLMGGLVVAIF